MKFILSFLILILINNCSLNEDSKYWTKDVVSKKDDKKEIVIEFDKSVDTFKMTILEYEIYIDEYTKKSKYPDINQ